MKKTLPNRYLVSVICLLLFFNNSKAICTTTFAADTVNIACGDSFTFGGVAYYTPVTQTDTFTSIHGCDSVVTLYLNVADTIIAYDTICSNDSILFNGIYSDTSGVYTAHYVQQNGACDSLVILSLTVLPAPVVIFTWDSLLQEGFIDQYNGSDTSPSAFWSPCQPYFFILTGGNPIGGYYSGTGISNDTLYAFQTWQDHYYAYQDTFTYTFYAANNCTQSIQRILFFTICEPVSNIANQYSLHLYPNPAQNYLTIAFTSFGGSGAGFTTHSQIEVLDLLGRLVQTEQINNTVGNMQLDIHALSNGMYFLRILNDGAVQGEGKFSVVR